MYVDSVYPPTISRAPGSHASAENSEPVGPYVSVPTYQPPYPAQPAYGPTLTPADASVPMPAPSPVPTGVPRRISSPQYPPTLGGPFKPPVQTRAIHPVLHNPRSHARQPLVLQELDAPQQTPRDWRGHLHFRRSRCTGRRKALCVRVSALALLIEVEQGYR
jgi:hypothetical protein